MAMNWLIENMENESVDLPFSSDELDSLEESIRDLFASMGLTPQMIVNTPVASPAPAAAAQSLDQRVQGAIQDGVCTFCATGRTYADQNWCAPGQFSIVSIHKLTEYRTPISPGIWHVDRESKI
jgi:hypothetical protein